jgi:hypothetical protein
MTDFFGALLLVGVLVGVLLYVTKDHRQRVKKYHAMTAQGYVLCRACGGGGKTAAIVNEPVQGNPQLTIGVQKVIPCTPCSGTGWTKSTTRLRSLPPIAPKSPAPPANTNGRRLTLVTAEELDQTGRHRAPE